MRSIENTNLVDVNDFDADTSYEVSEVYAMLEASRLREVEVLTRNYKTLQPLLVKVEEIVASTNTGKSPVLKDYYAYWERRVYNAIVQMVITSMTTLSCLINGEAGQQQEEKRRLSSSFTVAEPTHPPGAWAENRKCR